MHSCSTITAEEKVARVKGQHFPSWPPSNIVCISHLKECTKLWLKGFCTAQYCQHHRYGIFWTNHTIHFIERRGISYSSRSLPLHTNFKTFLVQLQSQTWHTFSQRIRRENLQTASALHPVHLSKGIRHPCKNSKQKLLSKITHSTNSE